MSLIKKPKSTEARRRASRRNGQISMGPTPFERAAEISPVHHTAVEERRIEDANFRQVWKLNELLMKMKKQEKFVQKGFEDTPQVIEKKRRKNRQNWQKPKC